MSQPTNGARPEPEWVSLFWAEVQHAEIEIREDGGGARFPNRTADLSGVTRQRVAAYARAHKSFKRRLLIEMAKALLAKAERIEERMSA